MRPVEFGEALAVGTRLTLSSDDRPDRFFKVIKFWMDETSGIARALKTGLPPIRWKTMKGRIHLLIHLLAEEVNIAVAPGERIKEFRFRSIFEGRDGGRTDRYAATGNRVWKSLRT